MTRILLFLLLIFVSFVAAAQDTPKPSKADLPDSVTLSDDENKAAKAGQADLEVKTLRAENLALQIQAAQKELKDKQEELTKAQSALQQIFFKIASRAKIPVENLQEYRIVEEDGKLVLKHNKKQ